MITLKAANAKYGIKVPTDTKEITGEVLSQLLSNVTLPKYYCVIALRYKASLFDLAFLRKNNSQKNTVVSVVPLMGKFNKDDINFIVNPGDRIIIDGSDIERGSHIGVNTVVTLNNITNYILDDEELRKQCLSKADKIMQDTIYCLEFKIVPINSIHGRIFGDIIDPFIDK